MNIKWHHENDRMVLLDQETGGTLHIWFNPIDKKYGSDLMWKTINDVSTALSKGDLTLNLEKHSMIEVRGDVQLKGQVRLRSAFLHDPVIEDSEINFVSVTAKTVFKSSQVHKVGYPRFGLVSFINTIIDGDVVGPLPRARELLVKDGSIKVMVQ